MARNGAFLHDKSHEFSLGAFRFDLFERRFADEVSFLKLRHPAEPCLVRIGFFGDIVAVQTIAGFQA